MRSILGLIYLFIGAMIFATPDITPRGTLFAVPVSANFRASSAGRRSITRFRALVAGVVLLCVSALLLSPESSVEPLTIAAPFLILFAGCIGFFWQNRTLALFSTQSSRSHEVDLTTAPDKLPVFFWLGAGPLAIIAAAAMFLHSNWARIPARFPIHWGVAGQPDRWSERSIHGVYGPLLFAVELCIWLLIMALAGWFGARRSRFRYIMLGVMVAVEDMIGLLFAILSIEPIVHIPIWIPVLGPMLFLLPLLFLVSRKLAEPGALVELTPNECWWAGVIYYNPEDAALLVQKRTGLGYTPNFGNRASWALLLGFALVTSSAFFLL